MSLPSTDLGGLLTLWEQDNITVSAALPPGLLTDPSLAGRLRGALYYVLEPDAARSLYGVNAGTAGESGQTAPRPWALAVRAKTGMMTVRVALFGEARRHGPALMQALPEALRRGIALHGLSDVRAPLTPGAPMATVVRPRLPARNPGHGEQPMSAVLLLHAPMVLRQGKRIGASASLLFSSLAQRAGGLASHMGLTLSESALEPAALQAASSACVARFDPAWPEHWLRRSGRQPGKVLGFEGFMGKIRLDNLPPAMVQLLAIGEAGQAGGRLSFGCGDYTIAWYP